MPASHLPQCYPRPVEEMQCLNGNEPVSLNFLILCLLVPLCPLICFSILLFSPPPLIHSGRLVIAFLHLSLSQILNLPHSLALLATHMKIMDKLKS